MKRTILYTLGCVVCYCFLCLIRQTSGQNTANSDLNYILCESKRSPILACSTTQIITIIDAIYGRTDSSVCPHPSVKSSVSYSCRRTATSRVASKCNSFRTCLPQSSNTYGDPCPGTYKYLNVTYRCIEGMTTNHINQSTSSPMKSGSNKSVVGIVAGIVAGVGFIALIIVIFILKRFSLSCFARNVPDENKNDEQDYTGNQNVAYINSNAHSAIQGDNNYYATLGNETDGHNYRELESSPQSEIEYHTNEPHSYMTVYDSFDQNRQSALTNATYEEVQQKENGSPKILGKTGEKHYDYAEFATNITTQDDI
ncbi:uncharacterized protein LOC127710060 isoform X1 [Mytilus californianus]|uniref:uncharacterized protein LOC127710060 isoform X1 n=1 Tax=Mytilus californianus TaxID=6549 RepID=UPI0022461CC9|nr:uncharacterized protein LOC127710060 isoform X1 [Mytilus californianus]